MLSRFYRFLLKNQIILALFIVTAGWFVFQIRDILMSIFIAYIIMAALLPAVHFLRNKKFPKITSVLIPYIAIFLLIFLLIIPLIPFVIGQINSLLTGFPKYLDQSATSLGIKLDRGQIQDYFTTELTSISHNAIGVTSQVFGGLLSMLTILVVSFYLLNYNDSFKKKISELFDPGERSHVQSTMKQIDYKLGAWMRGQIILCFSIGLATFIILSILNLPYALPLALIAGLLEILPTLGPILSAVPAIIVAITVSPTMAVIVAIAYLLIQMLENNLLVPKIMQHAVGLNPVIVILCIMIGANLMGVPGALLSIPFVSFIMVVVKSLKEQN